jgi:F-type H+-transporting ATPase subunit alpha
LKQVAGSLRLDLAQYRELAAFAGFGSDLDAATQGQLSRGARLVEILKQPQYQPLPMEKQVSIIFAGTKGYLDTLPIESLAEYEQDLYSHITASAPEIFDTLKEKKEIDTALEEKMHATMKAFTETFKASKGIK